MAPAVTQFDSTNLVQERIITHSLHISRFNSSQDDTQDKIVKLQLDIDNKLHNYLKITGILNNVFKPQKDS